MNKIEMFNLAKEKVIGKIKVALFNSIDVDKKRMYEILLSKMVNLTYETRKDSSFTHFILDSFLDEPMLLNEIDKVTHFDDDSGAGYPAIRFF